MKKILVLILLAVPLIANAEDSKWKWTKTDTVLQSIAIAGVVADWNQTRQMAKSDGAYYEEGVAKFFIGRNPTVNRVNWYFASSIILNTAVAYVLPNPYRRIFQVGTIGFEAYWINHNYGAGIRVAW